MQGKLRGLSRRTRPLIQHIVSEPHKRRIHQSSFNRDIIELGLRYEGEHPKRRAKGSLEKNLSTRIEDSDEV